MPEKEKLTLLDNQNLARYKFKTQKNRHKVGLILKEEVVPVGGLEPPRSKATDFESVVYTNFTTPASY